MRKIFFILLLALIPLTGCTRADQSVSTSVPDTAAAPTANAGKAGATPLDVTYCTPGGVELKMDLYYPKSGDGPWPVALYVHGGGWVSGDKSEGAGTKDAPSLVQAGFLIAAINYRLAPQYKFPAQIEDVKCAVRFLRAHAEEYNLDPMRIGVWGGSAGGHLVSLLGTSDESAGWDVGEYLDQSSRVQAVVDMFGPVDLTAEDFTSMKRENKASKVFGVKDIYDPVMTQASPVSHISADDPPFLILHGMKDDIVPPSQSQTFYEALQAAGVPARLVLVENAGHGLGPAGGTPTPSRAEVTQIIVEFFQQNLMP